ncbi:MAG: ABC transporter permease [Thermoguttaceae bacterium]|jgi:putative ABC transport system permease protein|nr:ABC transporter permease [Thermoguttaceae bacterium]
MRVIRTAGEGLHSLGRNKLRTFLMMAGTVVGVAALVVIMAIGKGTERRVMQRVKNFGPRAMMLIAGGGRDLPPPDLTVTTLTLDDAEAIRENIADLEIVTPQAWAFDMDLRHEGNQTRTTVWGVEPEWHDAWEWNVTEGEGITAEDVATMARVCIIGTAVKRDLFGGENPIGRELDCNKVRLTVKGVLEHRGAGVGGGEFDNRIIIPVTTAMRRVMNVDHVGAIRIITRDPSLMARQTEEIRNLMRERHRITPPDEDDFRLITPIVIAEMVRGTAGTLRMLLIALAGLSLLVGGVVLMNILLISVAERTAEIGLRRAVGATRRDIFIQFLTESLAVTLLGMVVGSVVGYGIVALLPRFTPIGAVMSWEPLALALVFALLVGTFFGVQPARRAARLRPVEALR